MAVRLAAAACRRLGAEPHSTYRRSACPDTATLRCKISAIPLPERGLNDAQRNRGSVLLRRNTLRCRLRKILSMIERDGAALDRKRPSEKCLNLPGCLIWFSLSGNPLLLSLPEQYVHATWLHRTVACSGTLRSGWATLGPAGQIRRSVRIGQQWCIRYS